MAKRDIPTDENGQPINGAHDYSNLPSVSDIITAQSAGVIKYKLDDIQNRNLVIVEATIEAGTFGSYAQLVIFDPATKEEKVVTNGSTLIMTQVSALINQNAIPCRVIARKLGSTWTLQ